jgi:endoglucanase
MKGKYVWLVGVCGLLAACGSSTGSLPAESVRLNQLGYYPAQEKVAVTDSGKIEQFTVVDAATGKEVLKGQPKSTAVSEWSGKTRTTLEFSEIVTPGKYILEVNGASVPFEVKDRVLAPLADAALKAFYYQRTGIPIEEAYAGKWNRPAGHPDDRVMVHPNAASATRPAGTILSSPKGWYDAGDYNKYIVNSAYSIGLMQSVYKLFPDYFVAQSVNIPESNNSTPDLLDEMYYNLDWMFTMQDPADGGVYHKLTTPSFEGFIKPTDCKQQRYVVRKSVTAALDYAAAMTQAARLFAPYEKDYPGFSKRALASAEKAYLWAKKNPKAYYDQDKLSKEFEPPVSTGSYGDNNADDEFFWAATELYLATGKASYRADAVQKAPAAFHTPGWGNVSGLGVFAWLQPGKELNAEDQAFADSLKEKLIAYCDAAIADADASSFHSPYGNKAKDFFWGCIAEGCADQGISLVYAYLATGNRAYLANAYRNSDYMLGRNATGFCYVTGFGTHSPMHPHHRLSASDDIEEPIPGFLVGGPNPGQQDGAVYPSAYPDESYSDTQGSYASNEIAINWNAALVGLASALDALSERQ